jgi:signal transduction histidine kinase
MSERRAGDDVEARVHALEQDLRSERAARAEAERIGRLKGELLAALSHEMRNPLNAILGWATILTRRNDLPEQVTQGLQAIERNSRLQARMISDLLDYAAIGEGKVRLVTETIDPYPVVRMALDGVAAAARSADVAIEAAFDGESMCIEADPARLQQIIANLLTNAVKFSNRGEAVSVMAARSGDVFQLVVSDRGKGIEPEFLPRIFDRFGVEYSVSSHRPAGLGLGMAIVKRLTDLHSGKIRAESAGRSLGAAFTLEIPLCIAAQKM